MVHGAFSVCFEDSSVSKFSVGQLRLERIALRPFDSKPAPHINNDVGPIDAWKGHSCHGEEANIAEDEYLGDYSICLHARGQTLLKTQGATFISKKKNNALPLEPVPQNHFGPTDASKGHCCHGDNDAGRTRIP